MLKKKIILFIRSTITMTMGYTKRQTDIVFKKVKGEFQYTVFDTDVAKLDDERRTL